MNVITVLRTINNYLSFRYSKRVNYDSQYQYLHSLHEPQDDIERSYNQFLCQRFSVENSCVLFLKNLSSFFLLFYYLHKRYKPVSAEQSKPRTYIYLSVNNKFDMLPDELRNQTNLLVVPFGSQFFLNKEDISFIKHIKSRYKFQFYFVYKTLLKIGQYSCIIKRYNPYAIITNGETSFTSSVLTQYCEQNHVKHINVMHGEKLFWIRDSFFRFTECYVWTQYHIDLFCSLRANHSHYIISLPPAMKIDRRNMSADEKDSICDYKFYLGFETKATIKRFRELCDVLANVNKSYVLRPHPVYTDLRILRQFFPEECIENTKKVGIEKSILTTHNVVSIFSTVLRQAKNAGVRAIIDDCSNQDKYEEIRDLKFWLCQTDHLLLSDEIKAISDHNI